MKYLKDIVKTYEKGWDFDFGKKSRLNYWLSVWQSVTDRINRRYNFACLAIAPNGACVGHLMAAIAGKPRGFHPVLFLINRLVTLVLLMSRQGRHIIMEHSLYSGHMDKAVRLGKCILAGKAQKVSEGISVAVDPEYRESGIYREMTRILLGNASGHLVFHTSTECVYQAHEKMGYKHLYKVPYPKSISGKDETYIMYGDKSMLAGAG